MASKTSPDDWFAQERPFSDVLLRLRQLMQAAGLTETIKWGMPCYTHKGRNVAGLGAFKAHFGIWFFEGARLVDSDGLLTNAQPGKTQMMRQMRFTDEREIKPALIKRYLKEAMALPPEKKKKAVKSKPPAKIPTILADAFKADPELKTAFSALRPSCQREYAEHIVEAKKPETRELRLGKMIPMIKAGLGLNDKYR